MKQLCVINIVILITVVMICCSTTPKAYYILENFDISYKDRHFLYKRADVHIYWQVTSTMFPKEWYEDPYYIKATPLKRRELARSLEIVMFELDKYPAGVLKNHLKAIYLLDTLLCSGEQSGGLYWDKTIYLTNQGESKYYTDLYLRETMHRELSSSFYYHNIVLFDEEEWKKNNREGFDYEMSRDKINEIAEKAGIDLLEGNIIFYWLGFFNFFSMTSILEDFNEYAAKLFCGSPELWDCYEIYDRIKGKTYLTIQFFEKIDPSFNKTFFRSLYTNMLEFDSEKNNNTASNF